jgi:hypothetical protein
MARTSRLRLLAAALACAGAASCGASIRTLYEGDVRFEHCMALDARPDVKPTLRRACWEQWAELYTFGQTRDRIEYARLRKEQLSTASDFDDADWIVPKTGAPIAAPDPTSAFAPPPSILLTDGGAPASAGDAGVAVHDCDADCQHVADACRAQCKGAYRITACDARFKRCARRCN